MPDGSPRFSGTPVFGGQPVDAAPRFAGVPMFQGAPVTAETPSAAPTAPAGQAAPPAPLPDGTQSWPLPEAAAPPPAPDTATGQYVSGEGERVAEAQPGMLSRGALYLNRKIGEGFDLLSPHRREGAAELPPPVDTAPARAITSTAPQDIDAQATFEAAEALEAKLKAEGKVPESDPDYLALVKRSAQAQSQEAMGAAQFAAPGMGIERAAMGRGLAGAASSLGERLTGAVKPDAAGPARAEPPPLDANRPQIPNSSVSGESPQTAPRPIPPAPAAEAPADIRAREAKDLQAWIDGKRPPAEPLHQPKPGDPVSITLPDGSTARGVFKGREGEAATVDFFDEPSNPEGVRGKTITGAARSLKFAPMELSEAEQHHVAANEAATSPLNDKPEPTEEQKKAGNYQKGHLTFQGLDVSIENPQGSTRSGTAPDGKPWSVELPAHYGYIKRTLGADGDHVDVYVGENPKAPKAFVVDQIDPATGRFDEHKALIGFDSEAQAIATYSRGFSDGSGPARIGAVSTLPMPKFKRWLRTGDTTEPLRFKESAPAPEISPVSEPAPPGRAQGAAPVPMFKGEPLSVATGRIGDLETDRLAADRGEKAAGSAATSFVDMAGGPHAATPAIAKLLGETDLRPKVADVAKAGKVTVEDAKRILSYLAGKGGIIKQTGPNQYRKLPRRTAPLDIAEFLASRGGIKDTGGELAAMDLHKKLVPGMGRLVRKRGLDPDIAREAAQEAGYLRPDDPNAPAQSSLTDLYDALDRNARGQRVFSERDRAKLQALGDQGVEAAAREHLEQVAHSLDVERKAGEGDEALAERIRAAERDELLRKPDEAVTPAEHAEIDEEREAIVAEAFQDHNLPREALDEFDIPFEPDRAAEAHPGAAAAAGEARRADAAGELGEAAPGAGDGREAAPGREAEQSPLEPWQMTSAQWRRAVSDLKPSLGFADNPNHRLDNLSTRKIGEIARLSYDTGRWLLDRAKAGDAEARQAVEGGPGTGHRAVIRKAIEEGKTVPPEVLADYPDLRQARFDAQRKAPETERTAQGEQRTLGAEFGRISDAETAQRGTDAGLKPKAPQKRADEGLFDVQGRGQQDLVERAKVPKAQLAGEAKPFFSALTRAIEAVKQPRGPAQQWRGIIDVLKQKGVKEEEIAWSGVRDWLAGQKGPVTKEAVLDHLRESEVKLEEVTKGGPRVTDEVALTPLTDFLNGLVRIGEIPREDVARWREDVANGDARAIGEVEGLGVPEDVIAPFRDQERAPTKFSDYTLPGGENYRELLLTLPSKIDEARIAAAKRRVADANFALRQAAETEGRDSGAWHAALTERQIAARELDDLNEGRGRDFRSSHFDEPNVLAHVRMNDRTGPGGEKILHVEEIQSDWHQAGRRKGYKDADAEAGMVQARRRSAEISEEMDRLAKDRDPVTNRMRQEPFWHGLARERDALALKISQHESGGAVPDAPFKTSWHELALKRVLRYAAEKGYDRVTWTTGEQQAARYDLSKQVDHLLYQKNPDGTFRVSAQAQGRGHMLGDAIAADKLEDHVGKDVAKRITDGVGEEQNLGGSTASQPPDRWRKLSGLDLKVGGEGMKGFYDKILPAAANKIGKPFGAKVGEAAIDTDLYTGRYKGPVPSVAELRAVARDADATVARQAQDVIRALQSDNDVRAMIAEHGSQALAEALGGEIEHVDKFLPVHSLDVTPTMRRSAVEQGFPMFRPGEPTAKLTKGRAAIRQAVHAEIQRLAPGTAVNVLDRHSVKYGDRTYQLHGSYLDGIITVALNAPDAVRTARHETIHALRDLGVIRPAEWAALRQVSEREWVPKYGIRETYEKAYSEAGHPDVAEGLAEEGVAEAFADFNPQDRRAWAKQNLPPAVFNVFKRLWNFFNRVRAALSGEGIRSLDDAFEARDVFERIQSGEVGKRPWRRDPLAEQAAYAAEGIERSSPLGQIAEEGKAPEERAEFPAGTDHAKPGREMIEGAKAFVRGIVEDLQMKVAPMAVGSDSGRVVAKKFANDLRVSQYRWTKADQFIEKGFTPAQRERMWLAGDEQSVLEQQGKPTEGKGLDTLSPEERGAVDQLHALGEGLWQRAKDAGIVKGEGLPSYMPRMLVDIAEDGTIGRLNSAGGKLQGGPGGRGLDTMGRNLTTAGPKHRQYLTAAETQGAAKGISRGAGIVRDVRTLPLAYSRLERAIAGKELINSIKELGTWTGRETVVDGARDGFFTLDHPAFQTYRPRIRERAEPGPKGGTFEPVLDDAGKPVFDKTPIYVAKEFEGPLRAVLTKEAGAIYNFMMALKGKTMSVIMYSPLIHNEVEWGRAFGLMPIEMLKPGLAEMALPGGYKMSVPVPKLYRDGYRLKQDPAQMVEAIRGGLVPIGHRGFNQDVTGIAEQPNLKPGRSLTAKVIGGPVGLVNEAAGNAVKRGIDRAGDFWHNTLLWDRVADLQMGIYQRILAKGLEKGLNRQQAVIVAAHEANRFAGALPNESMSAGARKVANFVLFSRSFTMGNLGAMKDMAALPRDLQAQLKASGADAKAIGAAGELAKSFGRRKAIGAVIKDIALAHLGVALVQNAVNLYQSGGDVEKELQGYADRWHRLVESANESLLNVANPFADLNALSPTSENEPGKENRVDIGPNSQGTEIYARLPTGKIGEEFEGYLTSPLEMLRRKVGTIMRPLIQIYNNDAGFGRQVYNPKDPLIKEVADAVWQVLSAQAPVDAIKGVRDIITGQGDKTTNVAKAVAPLAGITVSQGAPGGKAVGELYEAQREHWNAVRNAMPDINKKIQADDLSGAVQQMSELGMSRSQIRTAIQHAENPSSRLSKSAMKNAQLYMTPEQRGRMARALAERAPATQAPSP